MKLPQHDHEIHIFEAEDGNLVDRFTVLIRFPETPEVLVCYGMSEGGIAFNQYCGDDVDPGEHLGTELNTIPNHLKQPILDRIGG